MARSLWLRVRLIIALVVLMSVVFIVNVALDGQLGRLGIIPRSVEGSYHIITSPFIHSSLGHLLNNLVGLSVFGIFCLLRSVRFYLGSSLFIIVVGGALVWLFGRHASHVGASGWIFGLWSLSIAMALFDRRFMNIAIAMLVVFLYGGMVFVVLPTDPRVSHESHLFGAIAGIMCAFLHRLFTKNSARRVAA